jgi:hypothetical protein
MEFAEGALETVIELEQSTRVGLQEDAEGSMPTEQQSRVAIDELRRWIEDAGRAEDLEKHHIGGLRKTVMKDGRTLWLFATAAAEWHCVEESLGECAADDGRAVIGGVDESAPMAPARAARACPTWEPTTLYEKAARKQCGSPSAHSIAPAGL